MKKVVIVGGGTSGLFTAALMQKFWKDKINITLIYDPNNKNIGVGEGTTPVIVDVFKKDLYYDIFESIREVDATIKLGVLFKNWIPNKEYYHGFTQVLINDDWDNSYSSIHSLLNDCYDGGINYNNTNDLVPVDIDKHHIAYHITTENMSDFLFRYLKDKVTLIPDVISRVTSDGKNIQSITGKNTGNYHADLFVDASGFKSILLNELNPEWVDLSQYLPINRAIPQKVNNNTNSIPTYILAEATKDGWIWQIPTQTQFGTGYLYSSKFTTDDEARANYNDWLLTNHNVELETDRVIKWNTGYYKEAWIGNCFAVGISAGFFEPLEALTHQYLFYMVESFLSMNSTLKMLEYNRDIVNHNQNKFFTDTCDFLNLHYCTNRVDTPFWRHMTSNKTKWVKNLENKCKEEFIDVFRIDGSLDHWNYDNMVQILNGLNMLDKQGIKDYVDSMEDSEHLYENAKEQHDIITSTKNTMEMINHKEFLNNIKGLSTLPYI